MVYWYPTEKEKHDYIVKFDLKTGCLDRQWKLELPREMNRGEIVQKYIKDPSFREYIEDNLNETQYRELTDEMISWS